MIKRDNDRLGRFKFNLFDKKFGSITFFTEKKYVKIVLIFNHSS